MNDHFARILHEDRMTEYRGDAAASSRIEARRGTVKRRSIFLGMAALAATLTLLTLNGVFIFAPAA